MAISPAQLEAEYNLAFPGGKNSKGQPIDKRAFINYWSNKDSDALRDALRSDKTVSSDWQKANANNWTLGNNDVSNRIINAMYEQYFGRSASAGELKLWYNKGTRELERALINNSQNVYGKGVGSNQTIIDAAGNVSTQFSKPLVKEEPVSPPKGTVPKGGVGPFKDTTPPATPTPTTPTTPAPPEETLADKITKAIEKNKPGWEKEAYWTYLRDYGIEIPELTQKYGLPKNYDVAKTQYGLYSTGVAGERVIGAQELQDELNQLNADRTNALQGWQNLKARIGTGELDPNGQEYRDTVATLQQMTQAIADKKRQLSASGAFGGGSQMRALGTATFDPQTGKLIRGQVGETVDPYYQQIRNIHSQYGYQRAQGQSNYDIAMAKFLGDTKTNIQRYGIEQGNKGQFATGLEYGGGKWNPATQTFEGISWGLTPEQAQAQGLTFFGSDPYTLLIEQQKEKKRLESLGKVGMQNYISGQQADIINQLSRGY